MQKIKNGVVIVSLLTNWKELGFREEVVIGYDPRVNPLYPFVSWDICNLGPTYHSSLRAVKDAVRKENAIKKTPKYKWLDYYHDLDYQDHDY
jgi:hypothetical protein